MNKRICFISDSQVAALRDGWDRIGPEFPQQEVQFVGAITLRAVLKALPDLSPCPLPLEAGS